MSAKNKKNWGEWHLLLAVLLFSGCAPTTVKYGPSIARPTPGQYQHLVVGYFKGEGLSPGGRDRFTKAVHKRLIEEAVFRSVALASPEQSPRPDTVILRGEITELTEGSRFAQWLIGFGAGASQAAGNFEIVDRDGKALFHFTASTIYAGGIGIGGVSFLSLEDLLDKLASSVAQEAGKWMRGEAYGHSPE